MVRSATVTSSIARSTGTESSGATKKCIHPCQYGTYLTSVPWGMKASAWSPSPNSPVGGL